MVAVDHPFLKEPWRRVAAVTICVAWGLLELIAGAFGWAIFVLVIAALLSWQFNRIDWSKYDEG